VDADEYALELSRYIHLNPVRAKIVGDPGRYEWSSYRYFIKDVNKPNYMETGMVLRYFGTKERRSRKEYRSFVKSGMKEGLRNPFEDVKVGTILGGDDFVKRIKDKYLNLDSTDRELSAVKELRKVEARVVQEIVSKYIPKDSKDRLKMEIYILRKYGNQSLKDLSHEYGKEISAISQMNRRFKEKIKKEGRLSKMVCNIDREIREMSNV